MPALDEQLPPSKLQLLDRGAQLLLAAGVLAFAAALHLRYWRDDRPGVPPGLVLTTLLLLAAVGRTVGQAGGRGRPARVTRWLFDGAALLYAVLAARAW
jgi:hypothetical protein